VNCLGSDKADCRWNNILRNGIQNDAGLTADLKFGCVGRGQENGHVDILQIQDCQNPCSCADHFLGPSELILHPSSSGGDKHQIVQHRFDSLVLCGRGLNRRQGQVSLRCCYAGRRLGRLIITAALIENLTADGVGFDEFLRTLEVRFGEIQGALLYSDLRVCTGLRLHGALHIGLRGPEFRFVFRRRDAADNLSCRDSVALLHGNLGQAAGIFCRDVDLRRFEPAVGLDDPFGHRLAAQACDEIAQHGLGMRGGNERAVSGRLSVDDG
jgi:hypothetical protein